MRGIKAACQRTGSAGSLEDVKSSIEGGFSVCVDHFISQYSSNIIFNCGVAVFLILWDVVYCSSDWKYN